MHPKIQLCLNANLDCRYSFDAGPDKVKSWAEAKRYGLNCGALVHLLLRDLFGISLPSQLLCYEMFHDQEHFATVESQTPWEVGDVAFFGRSNLAKRLQQVSPRFDASGQLINWQEHPMLHLAMVTDELDTEDNPLFVHANVVDHGIGLWLLSDFTSTHRYQTLYCVRRLRHRPALK